MKYIIMGMFFFLNTVTGLSCCFSKKILLFSKEQVSVISNIMRMTQINKCPRLWYLEISEKKKINSIQL